MITLTADEKMLAILREANELAEIRDPLGTIVGFFAPVSVERAHLYAQEAAELSPAEIERLLAEPAYTTREVFEHLLTLTTDPAEIAALQKHIEVFKERDACTTP